MGFFERLKWRCMWSWAGLRDAWAQEPSFRSWVWANVVSGGLAIWLLDGAELALILALGVLVLVAEWSCHACVPVSELIYAVFRSNAKGLLPPRDECLRLGL
jgi:diacylglycerol kinase